MATKTNIVFKSFRADSFAGIDKNSSVVLVFPEGKNITKFEGNQGTGKTSALNALLYTMAQNIMVDPVNAKDLTTKTELTFIGTDGGTYRIRGQKTRLILEQQVNDRWTEEKTPQALIRKLVGHVGQDPMVLKYKEGAAQVEWIKGMFSLSEDALMFQQDLKKKLGVAIKTRTAINRIVKSAKARLQAEPIYSNFEENFKLHSQPLEDTSELEAKVQVLSKTRSTFDVAKSRLNDITQSISSIDEQIIEFEQKISQLRIRKEAEEARLNAAEKWIEENKSVDEDYKKAWDDLQAANNKKVERQKFESIKELHKEMEERETESQELTAQIDEYRKLQKKFIQEITPGIDGFEVCIPFEIDPVEEYELAAAKHPEWSEEQLTEYVKGLEGETREGLFYRGKSILQLSESELWECYLKFCKELGINVVMIENLTSLGTEAISVLNQIAESGVYIFASEMNRNEETMRVSFTDKI